MEPKQDRQKIDSQGSKHSDNLITQMMNQPCDLADLLLQKK